MFKGVVRVLPKEGILDPQGKAIEGALAKLGYDCVSNVRSGRYFEVNIKADSKPEAQKALEEIARRVLSNPVIDTFSCTLTEVQN